MSSDNYQTLWIQQALNLLGTTLAQNEIQRTGRALPCTVTEVVVNGFESLVTVEFEVQVPYTVNGETQYHTLLPITLPKSESQWLRNPTQVGDVGMTVPADTFLGGVSGQGSGTAYLDVDYGNLSTLVFVPIAVTTFTNSPDVNKAWVNGPNGAIIGDEENAIYATFDATTKIVTIIIPSGGQVCIGDTSGNIGNSNHAVMTAEDTQTALNAFATDIKTWANANFQSGSNGAGAPSVPTVAGSTSVFSKE